MRSRILDAAANLFSEKGFDGATLTEIARRARASKQLVHYHFRNKEILFREVHDIKFKPIIDWHDAIEDRPTELIARRFARRVQNPGYVRFLTWDAASRPKRTVRSQTERHRRILDYHKAIVRLQKEGKISARHDHRLLHLAVLCLSTYPIAFGQITKLVTGLSPTDPVFQKRWQQFLAEVGTALLGTESAVLERAPNATKKAVRKTR